MAPTRAAPTRSLCAPSRRAQGGQWNSPFCGIEGEREENGWFLSFHCFTKYIKVAFFRGASLIPMSESVDPSTFSDVMPAEAGTHDTKPSHARVVAWVPAFAGMTSLG
jgi:hypothetical protein